MAEPDEYVTEAAFLRGGGVSATLIANRDWASTPLGPIDTWPQYLRTTVGTILRSPIAMMLLWGEEGVAIFNDAQAKTMHDFGAPNMAVPARESWPELAEFIDYVIQKVFEGQSLQYNEHELKVHQEGKLKSYWFDMTYSPILDERGRPVGVLAVTFDATERVRTKRRAAVAAERRRRLVEHGPGFVCMVAGPKHLVTFVNAEQRRLFGDRDAIGKPVKDIFPEFGAEGEITAIQQVYDTGQRIFRRAERVTIYKPGAREEEHFVDVRVEPITGENGRVSGVFIEGFDVTEQVRAQAAVQESERRLSAALSVARLGAFEWNLESGTAILDPRAREIFGFGTDEHLMVTDVVARIEKTDLTRILDETTAAIAENRPRGQFEYRIHLPDGSTREIASVSDTMLTPEGRRRRMVGVFADVTERRRAEKRQQLLINELNHRVKNTLATIQSIATQTLRTAPDLTRAREAFESRLVALAAAHDVLTAQSWNGALLSDVAKAAMAPFESAIRPRIRASGPPVWLNAQHALALTLALHELATNASKYGALSTNEGLVTIIWRQTADGELTLAWTEEGGPRVSTPGRPGFGSRLLQRGLAHELRGEVTSTFAPEGVRCMIRCRLADAPIEPKPEFAMLWAQA
jgi:two-component sensor histidine kinase